MTPLIPLVSLPERCSLGQGIGWLIQLTGLTFFFFVFILFYVYVLCVLLSCCLGTICVSGVQGGQKRAPEPLHLELQIVVNSHAGVETKVDSSARAVKCS